MLNTVLQCLDTVRYTICLTFQIPRVKWFVHCSGPVLSNKTITTSACFGNIVEVGSLTIIFINNYDHCWVFKG